MVRKRFFISLTVCLFCLSWVPLTTGYCDDQDSGLPAAHIIKNVPWHQQINGLTCGAGSLEIIFDYYGEDIRQKEIADVARTSSSGTWAPDIVRAGHFSVLSSAQGSFYPHDAPKAGFEERAIGYAAFSHNSDELWLEELKNLIANDIPVIVLMKYTPDGSVGHYRVVIGYDDIQGQIYFSDTWGRDIKRLFIEPGVISWSYEDFQQGWNYTEYGTEYPYFGAVILPWNITLNTQEDIVPGSEFTVEASITYPCPAPMDTTKFPAKNVIAHIELPDGMQLIEGRYDESIDDLQAGGTAEVTWKVKVSGDANIDGSSIKVTASGEISGSVPNAFWAGVKNYYPAYDYSDLIGGEAVLDLEME